MICNKKTIELNEHFINAFNCMESIGKNVFITGKAGTGKSTLLSYFRENTRKKIAVLAPTGTAAVNIGLLDTNPPNFRQSI